MTTNIDSKHGIVSKQPAELYMAFADLRNFLQFMPEGNRGDVTADYDSITATVQGFKIGIMIKERTPYSRIDFIDDELRSSSVARCISMQPHLTHTRPTSISSSAQT